MDKENIQPLKISPWDTSRKTFRNLFLISVVILTVLPFWLTVQDVLTRIVMSVRWYRVLQDFIVPYEIRIIQSVLFLFGFSIQAGRAFIQWHTPHGNEVIYIIWNCVGWQTFILFLITLITGLSGKHTFGSKLEALLIGLLGTYLMNIFRIALVIIVYMVFGRLVGTIFHDYFTNFFSIVWLFSFWWLCHEYVLVEKVQK